MEKLQHISLSEEVNPRVFHLTIQLEGGGAAVSFTTRDTAKDVINKLDELATRIEHTMQIRTRKRLLDSLPKDDGRYLYLALFPGANGEPECHKVNKGFPGAIKIDLSKRGEKPISLDPG